MNAITKTDPRPHCRKLSEVLVNRPICTVCFAAFICKSISSEASVLEFHDDTRCEDPSHRFMQIVSIIVIFTFVFGAPILLWWNLSKKASAYSREHAKTTATKAKSLADDLGVPLNQAEFVVRDMTIGRSLGFLMDAYQPTYLYWEALDMLR